MRVVGANAGNPEPVTDALVAACLEGRPALVWHDGDDITGVFADDKETLADLITVAQRFVNLQEAAA